MNNGSERAWFVTWEWANDAAAVADRIAAVLPWDWTPERVAETVELLYAHATSTVRELVSYAGDPAHNPYRAETHTVKGVPRIICGPNPHLEAVRVVDVRVEQEEETRRETVFWTEATLDGKPGGARHSFRRDVIGRLNSEEIWDRTRGQMKPGFEHRRGQ